MRVDQEGPWLRFKVCDNSAGFEAGAEGMDDGHGFINMRDRLSAIGGSLEVTSAPGSRATVQGIVLVTPIGAGA